MDITSSAECPTLGLFKGLKSNKFFFHFFNIETLLKHPLSGAYKIFLVGRRVLCWAGNVILMCQETAVPFGVVVF